SFADPGLLREMLEAWPFFRATVDNLEMVLSKSDMGIAQLYSSLVEDRALAESIFGHIRETWLITQEALLAVTGQTRLLE
ncbi:phosphoenolpyruvate carboxylase, partial [Salmonella enterica]|uniref:phosphoenolpyruvate carboxylase n=1 Tax=Salmonella enterica TaxID=28901 RepID=UPI003CE8C90E